MKTKKIGIIGGGVAGAALGYYLSLYDGAEITIFEKDRIGCGSTAKSAGTVCLFDDSLSNRYWDVRLYGFETYLKRKVPLGLIRREPWWWPPTRRWRR